MAKLQCTVPDELDVVVARVEIRTGSRERALEYLIYLARLKPRFPKKKYDGERRRNCTLPLSDALYSIDFGDYREKHVKKWRKKKDFFPDALNRGASMYEAGYRLSAEKDVRNAALHPDGDWQGRAERAAAIVDFAGEPEGSYDALRKARKEHQHFIPATLFLIALFQGHHLDEEIGAKVEALQDAIDGFEQESDAARRLKLAQEFATGQAGDDGPLAAFLDWDRIPRSYHA